MNGLVKTYSANGSDTFDHNGKTGVVMVGYPSGVTGTVTLSHAVGPTDVTIESFTASGGAQFVSPLGTLKITVASLAGGNVSVIVQPLSDA